MIIFCYDYKCINVLNLIFSDALKQTIDLQTMSDFQSSITDPTLPLDEASLLQPPDPPPLPSRQVRFIPADPVPDVPDQDSLSWQVDGSLSNTSGTTFQSHFTMREYDEQLNQLKKENLNLKLRIYFMEEQQGMLNTKNNPENVYKLNIDLKVHGEELKKVSIKHLKWPQFVIHFIYF